MRTGKGRTFSQDKQALKQADTSRETGRGIVGGDVTRVPGREKGLQAYLDPETIEPGLKRLPELRRLIQDPDEIADNEAFLAHRPLEIEIGYGGGQFLLGRAEAHPETHFIGFEIRRHLCVSMVKRIVEKKLSNIKIIYEDVRRCLPDLVADGSLQRCSVFFPDPWWKKRHVKRRIVVPSFLDLMAEKLQPGGILHIKTDVMPYAEQVEQVFEGEERFERQFASLDEHFEGDLPTEREAFCQERGLPWADFRYVYKGS